MPWAGFPSLVLGEPDGAPPLHRGKGRGGRGGKEGFRGAVGVEAGVA